MDAFNVDSISKNSLRALFFGIVSYFFGIIQFNIPGIEGATSSLNEVPQLISIIYITNPLYILIVSLIASLITPSDGSYLSTFLMHSLSLIPFWFYYQWIKGKLEFLTISFFIIGLLCYYLLLLLPLMILTNYILLDNHQNFIDFYTILVKNASFEIVSTSFIVVLYLIQYNTNQKLESHIISVEEQVKSRTLELDKVINKLNVANDELRTLNEHLDVLVMDRTRDLEKKNVQLIEYAFINSHLLRAPLARILGLANIIKIELGYTDTIVMDKFEQSCHELDKIVELLNDIVSEESILDDKHVYILKEKIQIISEQISNITL